MSLNMIGGPGVGLPLPTSLYPATVGGFATGLNPQMVGTNVVDLAAGSFVVVPAGTFHVALGRYCFIQVLDPISGIWRIGASGPGNFQVTSDGVNHRVANLTGCPIGAAVTAGGAGYTSAPTVSASGHNSTWVAVLGGYVSAIVAATSGTGYTMNPIVEISAPAAGGVQATATAALSGSGLGLITVNNAGGGYAAAPVVTIIPNPLDPSVGSISNATATASITGKGQVTAVLCIGNGSSLTETASSDVTPTLVFAGGGYSTTAAATAIMCWTMVSATVSASGSGIFGGMYVTALPIQTTGTTSSWKQPYIQQGLLNERMAVIGLTSTGPNLSTGATNTIYDGGLYETYNPTAVIVGAFTSGTAGSTVPTVTLSVGGTTDTVFITPI